MRRAQKKGSAGTRERVFRKTISAAGMTLIELIVGLAISSVVSLMAAQFFSIVVRLHRSSTEISALQKDAQTIGSILERAFMGAEDLYFYDNGNESYLLLGRETDDGAGFAGEILYYDRAERKLYADMDYRAGAAKGVLFNTVRAKSEITRIRSMDYLVSNKVGELTYTLSRDLHEFEDLGGNTWAPGVRLAVTADYTMQYHESRKYNFMTRAVTRGAVDEITWNERR